MNDTAPEVSDYVHERYSAMRAEERFLIGIRMFDTARALVEASISSDLSDSERPIQPERSSKHRSHPIFPIRNGVAKSAVDFTRQWQNASFQHSEAHS